MARRDFRLRVKKLIMVFSHPPVRH